MREILFRGKRIDNGEWVEGSFCMDALEQFNGLCGVNGFIRLYNKAERKMQMHEVDRETVGQYTGLTDKHGKRIFEGDVLRDICTYQKHLGYVERGMETIEQANEYRYFGGVGVVEFCTEDVGSCGCCYPQFDGTGFKADGVMFYGCEVIGNIHDNPELLKGGAE